MRVVLDEMPQNPDPIMPGEQATVVGYDRAEHLMVSWDNGRTLNLIPGVDKFHVVGCARLATDISPLSTDHNHPDGMENMVEETADRTADRTAADELEKSFAWLHRVQHDLSEGNSSRCPRCGKPFDAHRGVFSKIARVSICDQCGQEEPSIAGKERVEDWYIVKIWQGRFEEE